LITWRFYQGFHNEWRWYQLDAEREIIAASDLGFAELAGCMSNAERAGFTGANFQVHARSALDIEQETCRR
jgi:hypothetical protein